MTRPKRQRRPKRSAAFERAVKAYVSHKTNVWRLLPGKEQPEVDMASAPTNRNPAPRRKRVQKPMYMGPDDSEDDDGNHNEDQAEPTEYVDNDW